MAEALTELAEVARFVHRYAHLLWRKGLGPVPEGQMVVECWMPFSPPAWARESAEAGQPVRSCR